MSAAQYAQGFFCDWFHEIISLPEYNFPFRYWKWGLRKDTTSTVQQQHEFNVQSKEATCWGTYTIAWYVLSQKGFRRAEVWSSKGGGCRAHWHRLRRPQLIIANGRHRHRPPCKKETLHPLWMNTHKHQRKTWAMSPPEIFWQELRR